MENNKNVFAANLNRLMQINGKSRMDLSEALGISYFTITAWVNGTKYPRMDKVEMLANYFGVLKSDLIEEKNLLTIFSQPPALNEEEQFLLDLFRRVPEDKRKMVLQMIQVALSTKE